MKFRTIMLLILLSFISGCGREDLVNTPGPGLPPAVPEGLEVVAAHDGSILIDWKPNAEVNLKGYYVYKGVNDSVSLKMVSLTSDAYFLDDSLSYDSTYFYKVSAVDDNGNESNRTYFVKARPVNLYAPRAVYSLEVNARNWIDSVSVFLSWQPNTEGDILGYEVYRSESPDFTPVEGNFLGLSKEPSFLDTRDLKRYVTYYYKLITVDKAGLRSNPGPEASDMILGIPEIVFPQNGSTVDYFDSFVIRAISVPAHYKVILQSNQYFGEIWSTEFSSSKVNDTLQVKIRGVSLNQNSPYYWRVITFTNDYGEPNSISALNHFTIRP
ncbi:MAG: hypothetical protein HF314_08870 [Ignavibacteria bacterium]|nr:hypothetical protein [Ignavibacteria bacterium]MCU7503173.1 hypothetical protein [Ignavibacteria bacterium]MCU7518051.1 hypothetical protein [Ignavibacteria bacterium]